MWGHAKRTPPLQVAFLWCQPPFPPPPKLRAASCALDCASQCNPHPGHKHTLPCGGRDTSSYPLAPALPLPLRGGRNSSHTALFAAMRPPPAISQGRAQCPLYMRPHEESAGALLSPQTPNYMFLVPTWLLYVSVNLGQRKGRGGRGLEVWWVWTKIGDSLQVGEYVHL